MNARDYAINAHKSVNHLYDGYLPYEYHLRLAYSFAEKYKDLILKSSDWRLKHSVFDAVWLHDCLEDVHHISYSDLKREFGEDVADIVYAVTNEKGKNRVERANAKYYQGIRETKGATYLKLCDRLANAFHGVTFGSSMLSKYRAENEHFLASLASPELELYHSMVDELKDLLK